MDDQGGPGGVEIHLTEAEAEALQRLEGLGSFVLCYFCCSIICVIRIMSAVLIFEPFIFRISKKYCSGSLPRLRQKRRNGSELPVREWRGYDGG